MSSETPDRAPRPADPLRADPLRDEVRARVRAALVAQSAGPSERPVLLTDEWLGILTEHDIQRLAEQLGGRFDDPRWKRLLSDGRLTPLAREVLENQLARVSPPPPPKTVPANRGASQAASPSDPAPSGSPTPSHASDEATKTNATSPPLETIAVGADHGGYSLKELLAEHLRARGFAVLDCGTDSTDACDYPVFARRVAERVRDGAAIAGVVVDGAGIGSAMTVNKVSGVRAAHCHNTVEARNAREHNHAHIVTLGAGFVGPLLAREIVDRFLATPFGGDRHARRVAMIETDTQGAIAP